MWKAVIAIAGLAGLIFFLKARGKEIEAIKPSSEIPLTEKPGAPTLDDLYLKHGKQKRVPVLLLKAIAQVESAENPNAENPRDPSVGLMQVLCVPDGSGGCKNQFKILDWPPPSKEALFDPDLNLHYASQILAWNIDTYGFKKGIAVYNNWSARTAPREGPFPNQDYVDKVYGKYKAMDPEQNTPKGTIYYG